MTWRKSTRIQRPRAGARTGVYRELARRLPRCGGSRRRLMALVERRNRGTVATGLEVTKEQAAAFAGWRGPLTAD